MPESHVTTQRFEDHLSDYNDLKKDVGEISKEVSNRVSWPSFLTITLLLVGIIGGILAILYPAVMQTKGDVSYIRGVLDSAEITK